jgi:hypothetical protein
VRYNGAMTSAFAPAELQTSQDVPFEERLFLASPLGVVGTAALIFALAAGSYFLLAAVVHYPIVGVNGWPNVPTIIPGIAASLLLATVLGMQRYANIQQQADETAFAAIIANRVAGAAATPRPSHMLVASVAGAAAGMATTVLSVPAQVLHGYPALYAWQFVVITLLGVLAGRGVVTAARAGRSLRSMIDEGLTIELLHTDRLAVIGRQSARNALVWFSVIAVMCLYFVGGNAGGATIPIAVACAGVGLWMFVHPMVGIHHRIQLAKEAELDRLRDEIGQAVAAERSDPAAAARLPGLIAYEARIQAVREWPFDHSTLVRVGAYVLLPTIPWFGEAAVSDLLQRLAH